jgi:hypothetical protein
MRTKAPLALPLPTVCILLAATPPRHALTITTFNILAPVHRSMDASHRESDREDWWKPRAEGVAEYIADKFVSIVTRQQQELCWLSLCSLHTRLTVCCFVPPVQIGRHLAARVVVR